MEKVMEHCTICNLQDSMHETLQLKQYAEIKQQ